MANMTNEFPNELPDVVAAAFRSWAPSSTSLDFKRSIVSTADGPIDRGLGLFSLIDLPAHPDPDAAIADPQQQPFLKIPSSQLLNRSAVRSVAESTPELKNAIEQLPTPFTGDERTLLVLLLLLLRHEAAITAASTRLQAWLPYANVLPKTFHSPLFYPLGSRQRILLTATDVEPAVEAKLSKLQREHAMLQPALNALIPDGPTPSIDDLKWADAVVWSRALSLRGVGPNSAEDGDDLHLIPYLDFANHAPEAYATLRWEPDAAGNVLLFPTRFALERGVKAGEELCISYGDRSNAEMLFLHGFAVEDNGEHDAVAFPAPVLETAEADDGDEGARAVVAVKMALLASLGGGRMVRVRMPRDVEEEEGKQGGWGAELVGKSMGVLDRAGAAIMVVSVMTDGEGLAPVAVDGDGGGKAKGKGKGKGKDGGDGSASVAFE
ncbi:hypothetical protein HK101_005291, partial [Irineochytrium annulatum]